jgi:preprotein translocase subunit SecB
MNLSPLQLNSFHLIHLSIDANENYKLYKDSEAEYDIRTDFDVLKVSGKQLFRVPLTFHIAAKAHNSGCRIKRLDVKVEGIFVLPEDMAGDMVQRLVPFNCLAILYSLSRGLILSITGNIPGGAFLLPTLDFTSIIKEKILKEEKEKETDSNNTRKGRIARVTAKKLSTRHR